jgi:hypothetical protein
VAALMFSREKYQLTVSSSSVSLKGWEISRHLADADGAADADDAGINYALWSWAKYLRSCQT